MTDKELASLKRKVQYLNKRDYKTAVKIAELAEQVPALIAEVERLQTERAQMLGDLKEAFLFYCGEDFEKDADQLAARYGFQRVS